MPELTLSHIARAIDAHLEGPGDLVLRGVEALERAGPDRISFVAGPRFRDSARASRAGALLVAEDWEATPGGPALLRHPQPNLAFGRVVELFAPPERSFAPGVHPSAVVAASARLAPDVTVGPLCVVEDGCELGAGVVLVGGVHLGPEVRVGAGSRLHPHVTVYERCTIGARCLIHAGVVIGADGFGFEHTGTAWEKIPQLGTVVIGDDVEIGANSVVDRARFGETRVESGAKLDDLVFVSHNSVVGEHAMMCGQSGIAGSTVLEPHVVLGAQAGVAGHATVKTGVRLGAQAGAYTSVSDPGDYLGTPARLRAEALRRLAAPATLERMRARLSELERRLADLEPRDAEDGPR